MSRDLSKAGLHAALDESRAHLLALYAGLPPELWQAVPCLKIINPPRWEVGHVAWFAERWCLRRQDGGFAPSRFLADADRWYDSSNVAHDTRWELLLPDRENTLRYMNEVLERCIGRIDGKSELSPDEFYFYWLATFHEGMHAEALAYTRQSLGYPPPPFLKASAWGEGLDPRAWTGMLDFAYIAVSVIALALLWGIAIVGTLELLWHEWR